MQSKQSPLTKEKFLELLSQKDSSLSRQGYFLAEGQFLCQRAREAGWEILAMADHRQNQQLEKLPFPVYHLSKTDLSRILGYKFHRGVIALIKKPAPRILSQLIRPKTSRILVLPHIGEQDNMGSLIRSAACMGTELLLIGPSSVDPLNRKSLRVSMGHIFYLPYHIYQQDDELLRYLKENNFSIVTTDSKQSSHSLEDFTFPSKCALIMGEEAFGLQGHWQNKSDFSLKIPMADKADSLNVSVAAGIILYCWQKNPKNFSFQALEPENP